MLSTFQCLRRVPAASRCCEPSLLRKTEFRQLILHTSSLVLLSRPPSRYLATAVARRDPSQYEIQKGDRSADRKITERSRRDYESALSSRPEIPVNVRRAVNLELPWLPDPVNVAERVTKILQGRRKDGVAFAITLVREASRDRSCVVAWNIIVDYLAQKGDIVGATKVYNEMKKRRQFPDARTYTLLLRGLALNSQDAASVPTALSLFNSMFATNAIVEPNIIHTNAVLNVCARAGNMDALWSVVSRIPDEGTGSADFVTYTTIIKALKFDVLKDSEWQHAEERAHEGVADADRHRRELAVSRGRTMWGDIAHRWHKGDVKVEESLLFNMGQLLLLSELPRHWDEVLSLVDQVANVSRQVNPLGRQPRTAEFDQSQPLSEETLAQASSSVQASTAAPDGDEPFLKLAPHVQPKAPNARGKNKKSAMHVQIGNPTLSMLLSACLQLDVRLPGRGYARAARSYWEILKAGFGVVPDYENYHSYLRILRRSRNSRAVVDLVLNDMKEFELEPKTFKIAMAACARNVQSATVLDEAVQLYEAMLNKLKAPDPKVMQHFVQLAREHPHSASVESAIKMFITARINVDITSPDERRKHPHSILRLFKRTTGHADRTLIIDCAQQMVGLIDLLPVERIPDFRGARSDLDTVIYQFHHDVPGDNSIHQAASDGGQGVDGGKGDANNSRFIPQGLRTSETLPKPQIRHYGKFDPNTPRKSFAAGKVRARRSSIPSKAAISSKRPRHERSDERDF